MEQTPVRSELLNIKELTLRQLAEKLFSLSTQLHQQFDEKVWQNQQHQELSYHNSQHVGTTVQAAKLLIQAAVEDSSDPLNILKELQKWNGAADCPPIQPGELADLFKIAFSFHDLGNIMDESLQFHQNGYQAANAEARSVVIAEKVLKNATDNRIVKFIKQLIAETTFQSANNKPFAQVMRVIDQLGGSLFLSSQERILSVVGLLAEMEHERGSQLSIDPHYFFNFIRVRFPELIPNQNLRQQLLKIWNKEVPKEVSPQEYERYKDNYQSTEET